MNDIFFTNSFAFRTIAFEKYHHTDHRQGSPAHYFAYMISGECKITTEASTVRIGEGDIFYIPDKCAYQSFWHGDPEIRFITLGFHCMPNFGNKSYPAQVIPGCEESRGLFRLLAAREQLSATDIGVFYTLAGILILRMKSVTVCRTKEITERTKEYLLRHPFATPAELAKNCAISEAALYFAFRKSSDITLGRLRSDLLLEKAKDILIATDQPIEFVADSLQFSSTSYFRKKFKQYFHMTPKELRRKYRI